MEGTSQKSSHRGWARASWAIPGSQWPNDNRSGVHKCDMLSCAGNSEYIYQPRDLVCLATLRRTHFSLAGQRAGFPRCHQAC
ncbi:MAG TPA: hypothetical protein VLW84_09360, partial [Terriglobales bacterium]|nr:hypothetical protein [Terriglobales bacterium]